MKKITRFMLLPLISIIFLSCEDDGKKTYEAIKTNFELGEYQKAYNSSMLFPVACPNSKYQKEVKILGDSAYKILLLDSIKNAQYQK